MTKPRNLSLVVYIKQGKTKIYAINVSIRLNTVVKTAFLGFNSFRLRVTRERFHKNISIQ
jgi:hypothetical protein